MQTVFKLSEIIAISLLPTSLKDAVIDAAFEDDSSHAVCLQAAISLVGKPGVKRNELHNVGTCNGINQASIVGKFIMVEEF